MSFSFKAEGNVRNVGDDQKHETAEEFENEDHVQMLVDIHTESDHPTANQRQARIASGYEDSKLES